MSDADSEVREAVITRHELPIPVEALEKAFYGTSGYVSKACLGHPGFKLSPKSISKALKSHDMVKLALMSRNDYLPLKDELKMLLSSSSPVSEFAQKMIPTWEANRLRIAAGLCGPKPRKGCVTV